mmetsp:Transcript_27474/g.67818  ORF Transcript_27474/g.67818 Transcript_27474/m.67818 type:complete len:205 (+) Transcript_27474:297-911(+)
MQVVLDGPQDPLAHGLAPLQDFLVPLEVLLHLGQGLAEHLVVHGTHLALELRQRASECRECRRLLLVCVVLLSRRAREGIGQGVHLLLQALVNIVCALLPCLKCLMVCLELVSVILLNRTELPRQPVLPAFHDVVQLDLEARDVGTQFRLEALGPLGDFVTQHTLLCLLILSQLSVLCLHVVDDLVHVLVLALHILGVLVLVSL